LLQIFSSQLIGSYKKKREELIQAINTQVKERELKFAQFFICPRKKHMLFMQKLH
jgi:hypothetical protein